MIWPAPRSWRSLRHQISLGNIWATKATPEFSPVSSTSSALFPPSCHTSLVITKCDHSRDPAVTVLTHPKYQGKVTWNDLPALLTQSFCFWKSSSYVWQACHRRGLCWCMLCTVLFFKGTTHAYLLLKSIPVKAYLDKCLTTLLLGLESKPDQNEGWVSNIGHLSPTSFH